jgi:hypothetical protein
MSWSAEANESMEFVKKSAQASPQEMGVLLAQMSTWASNNPNGGKHFIEFGKLRNHGVSFEVSNGEISNVNYGDTL